MINEIIGTIICSVFYHVCLSVTDSAFNRIIRRNINGWSTFPEWEWISFFFLGGCTFTPAFMIGIFSVKCGAIYLTVSCFFQWDLIFGKLVYGGWFDDTPSFKFFGKWRFTSLWKAVLTKVLVGILLLVVVVFIL